MARDRSSLEQNCLGFCHIGPTSISFSVIIQMTSYSKKKVLLCLVLLQLTAGILFLKIYKDSFRKTILLDLGGSFDLHGSDRFSKSNSTTLSKGNVSTSSPTNDEIATPVHPTLNYRSSLYIETVQTTQKSSLDVVHNLSNVVISRGPGRTTHHIYSAYYDSRQLSNRPAIVMFGYVSKRTQDKIHCKFVYEDNSTKCAGNLVHTPLIAPNVWPESYFCRLSPDERIPTHVLLSGSGVCGGEWSSPIPVWNREIRERESVGVCVMGALFTGAKLTNEMMFDLLVDFLAMVKVLGAKIVTIYNANARYELLEQVMKLYPGFVDMILWENLYSKLHYGGQRILLNDCLYRNMKRVKYVVYSDLDEVIYPVSSDNWIDMLKMLEKKGKYASYTFSNNFIAELPPDTTINGNNSCPYMNLRKYFVRLRRLPWPDFKQNTKMKMIVKPEALSALCIHDICKPTLSGYSKTYRVPMNVGLMAHYRVPVPHYYIYGEGVIDKTALKYRDQFMEEMRRVCSLIET